MRAAGSGWGAAIRYTEAVFQTTPGRCRARDPVTPPDAVVASRAAETLLQSMVYWYTIVASLSRAVGQPPRTPSPETMTSRRRALSAFIAVAAVAITHPPAVHAQAAAGVGLRAEIEALNAAMVAALKADPPSVARFYTDDASILGGGGRYVGRAQIDQYWADATMFADWTLEVLEVGGDAASPWVRGRSTLVGRSGRRMVTEFVGILKRQPAGDLKYYVDMYVAAGPATARAAAPGS